MMNKKNKSTYCDAIRQGFDYLLKNYPEVFIIGQGLWSPWYVGNSMKDLDVHYGKTRIIDTPVSESACTGAAIGASLCGMRPIIVHPRMDFMLYAIDSIVNQAAKWSYMTGGNANPGVTIRAIINRGGEQGAQHSQSLHSWFSHIPGLRVVMPSSVNDARDLLISSVLCPDPVLYIDDRWLYDQEEVLHSYNQTNLNDVCPQLMNVGKDITIVSLGFSTLLVKNLTSDFSKIKINPECIDARILNPFNPSNIIKSVKKTGRLLVVDGGWKNCGFAGEVIASITEAIDPKYFRSKPQRITLPDCPAPTSSKLEKIYYPDEKLILEKVKLIIKGE